MSMKKVVLTRTLHDFALAKLKRHYRIKIHSGKIPIPRNKLIRYIKDADGLICFPYDIIDAEIIDAGKNLKTISTYSVGYDHIDIGYARQKKIRVGYTPEVLTKTTADLAFALMIDVLRRVTEGDRIIRNGKWKKIYGAYDYVGYDLEGKTLGIIGMGRIGGALAKRAVSFDMKVLYHNRNRLPRKIELESKASYGSFSQILKKSDVISVHVPYTLETDRMFNIEVFRKMKKNAFLINTSRGKVINENDLKTALKTRLIAGAALDVFSDEPIGKDHPFINMPNVVLSPHIGSSTKETREKMAGITVENLILGMNGKRPKYSVGY